MPDNAPRATEVNEAIANTTPGTCPEPSVTKAELGRRLRRAVEGTAGVASLVPSMTTALNRLRLGRATAAPLPTAVTGSDSGNTTSEHASDRAEHSELVTSEDGITVALEGGTMTAVLDIRATTATSVLATALAVHAAATEVLECACPGGHSVTVNVLGLDPGAAGATDL